MNAATRNEIIRRWRADASIRQIARDLNLARNTVSRVLAEVTAQRDGAAAAATRRPSLLDPFDAASQELLGRYPNLTATRLLEELRQRGFTGGYTSVRQRLGELRPRAPRPPVVRFETAPTPTRQSNASWPCGRSPGACCKPWRTKADSNGPPCRMTRP